MSHLGAGHEKALATPDGGRGVVVRTKALFSFERMTCISWANSGEERCSASCIRTSSARCEKRAEGNAVCVDGRRSWRAGE